MKKIKQILAILICLTAPFMAKAQFGYGSGLVVTYGGDNLGGQFRCDVNTGPSTIGYIYSASGNTYTYNSTSIGSVVLSYNHPYYGWQVPFTVNISTINALATGASTTVGGACERYTITKNYGYSIIGATYNYTLSISVHENCY
jgi:hypothetical protein